MVYVIAAPCIADYSCLEVCPVDCIGPHPDDDEFDDVEQLYIDPKICVSCRACVDACPVSAIFDRDALPPKWAHYAEVNKRYFEAYE